MSELTVALAAIERGLERLQRTVLLAALRPGLDAGQRQAILGEVGLPLTGQIEALYAWRDGTDTAGVKALDDIYVLPGFYLLSLEDAVTNYRAFLTDQRWTPGWLPVLANGGGDFYVTDLGGHISGVVRHFRIEELEHPVEFHTVGDMLVTIAAGFERDIFFVDQNGYLEMDDLAYAVIAAELNPEVPWWSD